MSLATDHPLSRPAAFSGLLDTGRTGPELSRYAGGHLERLAPADRW